MRVSLLAVALAFGLTTVQIYAETVIRTTIESAGDAKPVMPEEDRVWDATRRLEDALIRSEIVIRDEALERYLSSIVVRLYPELADVVRVRLFNSPFPNAMALAHGALLFTTELVAMTSSEAELAFVVGHEVAHFKLRHASRKRDHRQTALGAGNLFGIALPIIAHLAAQSAVASYSRDMEREADALSRERCKAAGYPATGGVNALKKLDESTKEDNRPPPNLLASHPDVTERIKTAGDWVRADEKSERADNEKTHLTMTSKLRMNALKSEFSANRLANIVRKLDTPEKLRLYPLEARVLLLQTYLRRAEADDANRANTLLSETLAIDPKNADTLRLGGEISYKARDFANARRWFELALIEEKDSAKRTRIEEYLKWILEDEKTGS